MTIVYDHPESRHEVITAAGQTMSRKDATAKGFTIAPYADLVPAAARVAVAHPHHNDLVSLPPFNLPVMRSTARELGFTVSMTTTSSPAVTASHVDPNKAWRAAIYRMPEANARPAAAAEIVKNYSPATMSIDQVQAILRGLPVEAAPTKAVTPAPVDAKAARLAEIGDSMRAFNKANGHAVGHKAAPSLSNIPPDKLERLAEIQLAALTVRVGQGDRAAAAERSKLQHALKMKATAGTPLVQALVQMGVNTAAIVRGA